MASMKRHVSVVCSVLMLVSVVGCGAHSTPATQQAMGAGVRPGHGEEEQYRVYNAVLRYAFADKKVRRARYEGPDAPQLPATQLVIAARTLDVADELKLSSEAERGGAEAELGLRCASLLKGCTEELAREFYKANLRAMELKGSSLSVEGMEIILVKQDSYVRPQPPSWFKPDVTNLYPGCQGVTLLSRVAFSEDGRSAVVSLSTSQYPWFGWGHVYLLRKEREGWKVIEGQMTYIQ